MRVRSVRVARGSIARGVEAENEIIAPFVLILNVRPFCFSSWVGMALMPQQEKGRTEKPHEHCKSGKTLAAEPNMPVLRCSGSTTPNVPTARPPCSSGPDR